MDLELGVVCGRCDRYSAMGATACSCGNDLALFPPSQSGAPESAAPGTERQPARAPSAAPPTAVAKPPSAAPPPPSEPPESAPPQTQNFAPSFRPPAAETVAANVSEPPPVSLLQEPLVRRRTSLDGPPIRAIPAQGGETAVSSSGAFSDRTSVGRERAASPAESPIDLAALAAQAGLTLEQLMDQAKNFVCRSCSTPVPVGHKFCGRCGAAIPPEILGARTQFFGQLQTPGKAKLILIRGEGVEGLSYQLNAEQHIVGRNGQLVFPDDPFVSPKHANLFYRGGKLVVRDEGSLNGVFVRVRGTVEIASGDQFLAGEQLFRVEAAPKANDGPAPDGTYFYSSPKHQSQFRITQVLQGGAPGMLVVARGSSLQIGREGGDLNFPGDLYMSATHCKVEEASGKFTLTDVNSRNGTYLRLKAERELAHGDYLFIGRKLLRVEITAAA